MRVRLTLIPILLLLAACNSPATTPEPTGPAPVGESIAGISGFEVFGVQAVKIDFTPPEDWGLSYGDWKDLTARANDAYVDDFNQHGPMVRSLDRNGRVKGSDTGPHALFYDNSINPRPPAHGEPLPSEPPPKDVSVAVKDAGFAHRGVFADLKFRVTKIDHANAAVEGVLTISDATDNTLVYTGTIKAELPLAGEPGFTADRFVATMARLAATIRADIIASREK